MKQPQDPYIVFGISRNADADEIKKAYRALSKKHHPDSNPDDPDAALKMAEINSAYAILSNADKKAEYDKQGFADPVLGRSHGQGQGDSSDIFGGVNFNDFNFDEAFKGAFGFSFEKGSGRRGQDITISIRISPAEAAAGALKEVTFSSNENCTACNGTGAAAGAAIDKCQRCDGKGQIRTTVQSGFGKSTKTSMCPTCRGKGKEVKGSCPICAGLGKEKLNRRAQVVIPKGTRNGQTIKVEGMGEQGAGGNRGNLIVKISVR